MEEERKKKLPLAFSLKEKSGSRVDGVPSKNLPDEVSNERVFGFQTRTQ